MSELLFFFMVPIFEYLMSHYFVVILTAADFHNVITQQDMPSRRLQYVFETCLQDAFKTCLQDILKVCIQDIFKTSWRQKMGISVSNKSKWACI